MRCLSPHGALTRPDKVTALADLARLGGPAVAAVAALMRAHLADALDELEGADGQTQIFRAQGRAALARDILGALTRTQQELP